MKITTTSPKETLAFAKNFARTLKGGEVIGLIGDLGAGKTAFTQGLAKGLGIKAKVNSPTFVIMKVYEVKRQKTKDKRPNRSASIVKSQLSKVTKLVHIDAYRLNSGKDLEAIGALDYFGQPDTIVVIEWADRVKEILPKKSIIINIKANKNLRNLTIK
jgi:tRNA threonylcarbamoyladenosine biosynthesis protein TsaE